MKSFIRFVKALYYSFSNEVCGLSLFQRLFCLRIYGKNNIIVVNKKAKIGSKVGITIYGEGHRLTIGDGVIFKTGSIWFEDKNCSISIDNNTTLEGVALACAETGTSIRIGYDCMFSSNIYVATTDSHSIINNEGTRINHAKSVIIGNHVWVGRHVTINKGVVIGENSIVAGNSVVTKDVQNNTIVAGVPAHEIKDNINWLRERI